MYYEHIHTHTPAHTNTKNSRVQGRVPVAQLGRKCCGASVTFS